ncbi:hypothetical protein D8674_006005 [Pyrus ussuriensis x Pyrus communis]|uniref:dihydropyrimidinase n=1 Tax=Pyrus ussuriensis x Pyrus communis TaxID=2448454 RepID=A0A5N5FT13_9ROSA|nr:hypothetical protein D8674_006005 [Pyrus ussuriensis x Pyrus communis]
MASSSSPQRLVSVLLLFLLLFSFSSILESSQFCDAGIGHGESTCGVSSSSSSTKLLIKGGTVVNVHDMEVADVYVQGGINVTVKPIIKVGDDVIVLDATGKLVMPGHFHTTPILSLCNTHLGMEFMGTETMDDFFSGQAAALAGGTTMHIDFVLQVNGSLLSGWEAYEKKSTESCMGYVFHMAITKRGSFMVNDELLLEGFMKCKSLGALAMHEENGDTCSFKAPSGNYRSNCLSNSTCRFCEYSPYVLHVMSIHAMEEISKARKSAQKVIGEAVVSGLVLNDSWLCDTNFITAAKHVMSPSIRAAEHDKALQVAISMGVLQLVGTDRCIFNSTQKESGQISLTDYVWLTNTECARAFNISPRKGGVRAGSDADIIILNPNSSFGISPPLKIIVTKKKKKKSWLDSIYFHNNATI